MRSPVAYLRGVRHPGAFHGRGAGRPYFEGWYVKLVSTDLAQRWAVIPGIFRGESGADADEAFVQVLDGLTGRSWCHTYPASAFEASDRGFDVTAGPNRFDAGGVTLDLPQLRGRIDYTTPLEPWPSGFAAGCSMRRCAAPCISGWKRRWMPAYPTGLEVFGDIDRLLALKR